MTLYPTDDYILLEELQHEDAGAIVLLQRDPNEKKKARAVAVGPGVVLPSGARSPQPCNVGDVVLVHAGAGFHTKFDGREYWFVHGNRQDIIAVVS